MKGYLAGIIEKLEDLKFEIFRLINNLFWIVKRAEIVFRPFYLESISLLLSNGWKKPKTRISSAPSDQMEAGKFASGSSGFGGFCLYRFHNTFHQKPNPKLLWHRAWRWTRFYQYHPLLDSDPSALPDFFVDLWLHFRSV